MQPLRRRWLLLPITALLLLAPVTPALADEDSGSGDLIGIVGDLVSPAPEEPEPEPPPQPEEPPPPADPPPPPPPPAPDDLAVQFALEQVGKPYTWGGDGPPEDPGYDCSGLVHRAYAQAYDRTGGRPGDIPRTADSFSRWGQPIGLDSINTGDLLFWDYDGGAIDHVAMFTGRSATQIVEASNPDTGVRVRELRHGESGLVGAIRPPRTG